MKNRLGEKTKIKNKLIDYTSWVLVLNIGAVVSEISWVPHFFKIDPLHWLAYFFISSLIIAWLIEKEII